MLRLQCIAPLAALVLLVFAPQVAFTQDSTAPEAAAPASVDDNSATPESAGEEIQADPAAASSAARIIAPADAPDMTTGEATTASASSVPSMPPSSGRPEAPSGPDDVAVEKAAEIMRTLGLVRPPAERLANSGEADETTPTQLFNEAEIRRLLSADPTVVYQVVYQQTPLPDPMVVPWVRNRRVIQERFDQAVDLIAKGKVTEARERLEAIIQDFPDTEHSKQAEVILEKLSDLTGPPSEPVKAVLTPKAGPEAIIQLDPNVRVSAVVVDSNNPDNNLAMVSGRTYRAGDSVQNFPNHRIVKIETSAVEVEVEVRGEKKTFRVPVLPQGRL